ncbi:hypothetical protein CCACVL1_25585 [Corchorus capsularis]|uniref:RRM domain-containing protein n=1 Tax=Corchorus capsularis TaxID=210143 RepID=A0A1R3GJ44_COCAP|nr:hypothetical protein CCACVL1_25585 [Corchorus capsularis]
MEKKRQSAAHNRFSNGFSGKGAAAWRPKSTRYQHLNKVHNQIVTKAKVDWRSHFFSVFVGNLHGNTTLRMLWQFFKDFGVIVDAFIPHQHRLGAKFAFVKFRTKEEANRAIMLGNGGRILNHQIRVCHAKPGKSNLGIVQYAHKEIHENLSDTNRYRGAKVDGRLFTEVVAEKSLSEGRRSKEVSLDSVVPQDDMTWLHRSAKGRLRSVVYYKIIEASLIQQGVHVSLIPICDLDILITFMSSEEMAMFLQEYPRILKCEVTTKCKLMDADWIEVEVDNKAKISSLITGKADNIKFSIGVSIVNLKLVPVFTPVLNDESSASSEESPENSPLSVGQTTLQYSRDSFNSLGIFFGDDERIKGNFYSPLNIELASHENDHAKGDLIENKEELNGANSQLSEDVDFVQETTLESNGPKELDKDINILEASISDSDITQRNKNLRIEVEKTLEVGSKLGIDFGEDRNLLIQALIATWNIRGIGRKEKRNAVRKLVFKEKLDMIHLQETKSSSADTRQSEDLWEKLSEIKPCIKHWYFSNFGANDKLIKNLEEEIHTLEISCQNGIVNIEKHEKLLSLRGELWRRLNRIEKLDWQGNVVEDPSDIKNYVADFFEAHFNKKETFKLQQLDMQVKTLSDESRSWLERSFSEEEIFAAIQSCDGDKALGPDSLEQLLNIKRILRCFQLISGLKINFNKSSLIAVGLDLQIVEQWAATINCKVGSLPCKYLGLLLGARHAATTVWKSVVEGFKAKLESCRSTFLSLGGRITMIKKMHLVEWNVVCKPKEKGGLGIVDLHVRNRALLNKWLWRFADDRQALSRQLIVDKYGLDSRDLFPKIDCPSRYSKLWLGILKPLIGNDSFASTLKSGIQLCFGDGNNIKFWTDVWISKSSLKEAFPRIYALATNKEGRVCDYGTWGESGWEWRIELRRPLLDWEKDLWKSLMSILDGFTPSYRLKDKLIWKFTPSGRVPVKAELARRGVIDWRDAKSPLCLKEIETSVCVVRKALKLFDLIRTSLVWWMMARWPNHPQYFVDLYRFPFLASIFSTVKSKEAVQASWKKPDFGVLKFNVDGAAKGKPGLAGICGILRNHQGNTLAKFSKSIGIAESNEAELLAIKEAFLIFGASRWANAYILEIETDSYNALK